MLHKDWNSKEEEPSCFPRSSIKFQGHTGQNITDFDPNWAFPDYRPVAAFKSLRFALFCFIVINENGCDVISFTEYGCYLSCPHQPAFKNINLSKKTDHFIWNRSLKLDTKIMMNNPSLNSVILFINLCCWPKYKYMEQNKQIPVWSTPWILIICCDRNCKRFTAHGFSLVLLQYSRSQEGYYWSESNIKNFETRGIFSKSITCITAGK